jgi:hypothetical protein
MTAMTMSTKPQACCAPIVSRQPPLVPPDAPCSM